MWAGDQEQEGRREYGGEMRTSRQHWVRVSTFLAHGVNLDNHLPMNLGFRVYKRGWRCHFQDGWRGSTQHRAWRWGLRTQM